MYPPYNNPYGYGMMPQQIPQQKAESNIQWVQGLAGAKAYPLPPNGKAIILDSEEDGTFYIKTSDDTGMCKLRVFKFEEVTNTPDSTEFVTRKEFQDFIRSINEQVVSRSNINAQQQNISDSANG